MWEWFKAVPQRFRLDISFLRGWSNPGTGFLERWLIPQAFQYLRDVWTMPLIACFKLWSGLNWSGSWTDDCCRYLSTGIVYSNNPQNIHLFFVPEIKHEIYKNLKKV